MKPGNIGINGFATETQRHRDTEKDKETREDCSLFILDFLTEPEYVVASRLGRRMCGVSDFPHIRRQSREAI
jgi:hypothetical protein